VFGNDFVKAWKGWVVGDHKWDTFSGEVSVLSGLAVALGHVVPVLPL